MRPEYLEKLSQIAPCIAITVTKERDPDFVWDGDGPDPAKEGYFAYDVEVEASAIIGGELRHGRQTLGGSYYKLNEGCGEVHGYLPQMVEEALTELQKKTGSCPRTHGQVIAAIGHMQSVMRQQYDQQRKA